VLYHYTSAGALAGILSSRSFWATNIRFLNDSKEFELAKELLAELLEDEIEEAESKYDKALYRVLQEGLSKSPSTEVFVASFSEDGDQLGQWRAYCPAGSGYALGVTPAVLRQAYGIKDRPLLLRCLYDDDEHQTLLSRLIGLAEDYLESSNVHRSDDPDRVYREAFKVFIKWLPTAAAVIKHPSFREEKEWRLIAPSSFFRAASPAVRAGRSMLIPYHAFVLVEGTTPMSIHDIVVGPTPHPTLAVEGVEALCAVNGARTTPVTTSDIPYRTW
jgi:hypothetical protein